jgi:hypothetical protein
MKEILKKFPSFELDWKLHCEGPFGNIGLSMDLGEFSHYTSKLLMRNKSQDQNELKEIFNYIEYLLQFGDDEVKNAAATCFLETISNQVPDIKPSNFVPLLGKESKEYLKAWDEFTGVKTEGLW